MSDSIVGLLFELYETDRATAYSNFLVGIVFGAYVVLYGMSLYILLRNDGLLRSAPRMFMLVVSTVTFALGLIALVLETSLAFQNFARELSSSNNSLWSTHRTNIVVAVCATITYLVVSVLPSLTFTFFLFLFLLKSYYASRVRLLYSFYSPTLSVRGERP